MRPSGLDYPPGQGPAVLAAAILYAVEEALQLGPALPVQIADKVQAQGPLRTLLIHTHGNPRAAILPVQVAGQLGTDGSQARGQQIAAADHLRQGADLAPRLHDRAGFREWYIAEGNHFGNPGHNAAGIVVMLAKPFDNGSRHGFCALVAHLWVVFEFKNGP